MSKWFSAKLAVLVFLLIAGDILAEGGSSSTQARTTENPNVPTDQLTLLLQPMSKEELLIEADGWLAHVKSAVKKLNAAQLEIMKETQKAEAKAEKESKEQKDTESAVNADMAEADEEKSEVLDEITELNGVRTSRIDRLNVVLDEINAKIGMTADGTEKEEVLPYRRYINAVSGLNVDVTDTQAALSTIVGWAASDQGGIRWTKNISVFLITIIVFWVLARFVSKGVRKAISVVEGMSVLLSTFIVGMVQRVIMIIGIIVGLAALEVNIGPLLAVIGAAGFVVAFALQDTLSNFASGIMIMFYRPFDVDDVIDVSGIIGKVQSMNLVTTTVMTFDNKLMIVPNNSIWGNIITNATGSEQRRVDLVFGIGYQDDIAHAERVLKEIVDAHPLILMDPEPVIQLHELADSSCNFVCRPWAKTEDFWTVYWDVTRSVKERFDAEGISIPFPQRDVHIIHENPATAENKPAALPKASTTAKRAADQAGLDEDDFDDTT